MKASAGRRRDVSPSELGDPLTANRIPRRPGDIDVATFRALTARDDVTAVRVRDVDHGTATRARMDITGAPDLPATAFVKLAPCLLYTSDAADE